MSDSVAPAGYAELLAAVKVEVRTARLRAHRVVNTELLTLYWAIGNHILARQSAEGWGTRVIERLAEDLRAEFPDMRGLSRSNLHYMRKGRSRVAGPNCPTACWTTAVGPHHGAPGQDR